MRKDIVLILIGALVTIMVSIGGSYLTTLFTLAIHEERLKVLERQFPQLELKVDKQTEILNRVDKTTAILEERTKPNK